MSFRQLLKFACCAAAVLFLPAWRNVLLRKGDGGDDGYRDPTAIRVIRSVGSRDVPFKFDGRKYYAVLYKRGNRFFLLSRIMAGDNNPGKDYLVELGKNVVISPAGLVFENGRLTVEYYDPSTGKRKKADVPFGDVYGHKHVSEMPPEIRRFGLSKKYGVSDAFEKDDAAIESCLPILQELLRRDDAEALADMMIYPLPAHVGPYPTFIKNREEFVKFYPRIFTPTRKRGILKLDNTDIFRNYKGLMLDRGLWFTIATDGKPYFRSLFFVID